MKKNDSPEKILELLKTRGILHCLHIPDRTVMQSGVRLP